jgi:protein gp37
MNGGTEMGEKTGITWTNHTWNPWRGCHKVSQGCKNCYMFREQERFRNDPTVVVRSKPRTFNAPLTWKDPALVFTCSWSDWCIEEADPWRDEAWEIIRKTPHLTYQILTKRAADLKNCLPEDWGEGWPNVWLGVTVEDQDNLWRAEALSEIPAKVRFISYEPAIGHVRYFSTYSNVIQWVIVGGESGPGCRPMKLEWAREVIEDCRKFGVACFVKQLGGVTDHQADPAKWPEDLRVQQFPVTP